MTEADLKRGLVEAFNALPGVFAFRVETTGTMIGIPDVVANRAGAAAWIEVKYSRPSSRWKTTAAQERNLKRLHGYLVTYVQRKDGEKYVELTAYLGGGATKTWRVSAERGFAGAHDHVAREIALLRLDF